MSTSTKRKDFYKGCKDFNSIEMENYLKGKQFDVSNKVYVNIQAKPNKYNMEFVRKLNEIQFSWYKILLLNKVALQMINNCEYGKYINKNDVWRLIKAQSATIRYNRTFKFALKKYGITTNRLYKLIEKEIERQDDRIRRNTNLIIEFLRDIGLGSLMQFIEENTGMSIIDHIYYFCENNDKTINYGDTIDANLDDEQKHKLESEYYDKIIEDYIIELMNIAQRKSIDINNNVNEYIKTRYENKQRKAVENKEKQKENKEKFKKLKSNSILTKDNIEIQNKVNNLTDYDMSNHPDKYAKLLKILLDNNNLVYYIAMTKSSSIFYISPNREIYSDEDWFDDIIEDDIDICERTTDNTDKLNKRPYKLTKSVANAKIFASKNEATEFFDAIKDYYSDYTYNIFKVTLGLGRTVKQDLNNFSDEEKINEFLGVNNFNNWLNTNTNIINNICKNVNLDLYKKLFEANTYCNFYNNRWFMKNSYIHRDFNMVTYLALVYDKKNKVITINQLELNNVYKLYSEPYVINKQDEIPMCFRYYTPNDISKISLNKLTRRDSTNNDEIELEGINLDYVYDACINTNELIDKITAILNSKNNIQAKVLCIQCKPISTFNNTIIEPDEYKINKLLYSYEKCISTLLESNNINTVREYISTICNNEHEAEIAIEKFTKLQKKLRSLSKKGISKCYYILKYQFNGRSGSIAGIKKINIFERVYYNRVYAVKLRSNKHSYSNKIYDMVIFDTIDEAVRDASIIIHRLHKDSYIRIGTINLQ